MIHSFEVSITVASSWLVTTRDGTLDPYEGNCHGKDTIPRVVLLDVSDDCEWQLVVPNQLTCCLFMIIRGSWRRRSRGAGEGGSGPFSSSCSGEVASGEAPGESRTARVQASGTRRGRRSSRTIRCTS
jgi:hypothetical protein